MQLVGEEALPLVVEDAELGRGAGERHQGDEAEAQPLDAEVRRGADEAEEGVAEVLRASPVEEVLVADGRSGGAEVGDSVSVGSLGEVDADVVRGGEDAGPGRRRSENHGGGVVVDGAVVAGRRHGGATHRGRSGAHAEQVEAVGEAAARHAEHCGGDEGGA